MAKWDKITSRGKVEDRRSFGPAAIGGISLAGLVLIIALSFISGGDAGDVLSQLESIQEGSRDVNSTEFEGTDEYEDFASRVLGSNNDMWVEIFQMSNRTYRDPKLVLFRTATESACGVASSAVGPHYCPLDKTIYLDETFFEELRLRYGAKGGDVAEAYVISHEAGHHAQNEMGILDKITSGSADQSIKLELQADCFSGLWAYSIRGLGVLEPGEIGEAMDAAAAVGDDRIQEKVNGQINPETWTHGSSEDRVSWFTRGYESGELASCNTFAN